MTTADQLAPTEEQLRLAYRELYRPGLWPTTFDAAMASHAFSTAITRVAFNRNRMQMCNVPHKANTWPSAPVPPTPSMPPNAQAKSARSPYSLAKGPQTMTVWPTPRLVDRKRLAGNDKDDE